MQINKYVKWVGRWIVAGIILLTFWNPVIVEASCSPTYRDTVCNYDSLGNPWGCRDIYTVDEGCSSNITYTLCPNGYYEGACANGCCQNGTGTNGETNDPGGCQCGRINSGACAICIGDYDCRWGCTETVGCSGEQWAECGENPENCTCGNCVQWGTYCPCNPNIWSGCSASCGVGTITNNCGGTAYCYLGPCCNPNDWSEWTACTGTQVTQARANDCGTIETQDCPSIKGTVYYDPYHTCAVDDATNLGLPLTVTYNDGVAVANVSSDGTYRILTGPAGAGPVLLQGLSGEYECSTCNPLGCTLNSNTLSPSVGNNFFIADRPLAWWQTVGGGVYVGSKTGGTTVSSSIPRYVAEDQRYLIIPGTNTSVAALLRASGNIETGRGEVSTDNYSAVSEYKGKRMDYQFFAGQIGVTFNHASDWGADTMNQPAFVPSKKFFYQKPASGTATVSSPWHVLSGESYTVVVNGNLSVAQDIVVDQGGFLAFIVKGNISVQKEVERLEGLFVMDGQFSTLSDGTETDVRLITGGSIVAWGGVNLGRDVGKTNNAAYPSEQFVYRPDLLENMPADMKTYAMGWSEVPAGTFGE